MMKKRFFALLLAFAILLCAVPVALAEAQTKDTIPDAESYLDLYVKDGLVALFDGYSVAASSTPLTEWKPVDLYGRAGYEDYSFCSSS